MQFLSPDSARAELVDALLRVNREAGAERRRGFAGVHGPRYAGLHGFINALLDLLDDKPLYVEE